MGGAGDLLKLPYPAVAAGSRLRKTMREIPVITGGLSRSLIAGSSALAAVWGQPSTSPCIAPHRLPSDMDRGLDLCMDLDDKRFFTDILKWM